MKTFSPILLLLVCAVVLLLATTTATTKNFFINACGHHHHHHGHAQDEKCDDSNHNHNHNTHNNKPPVVSSPLIRTWFSHSNNIKKQEQQQEKMNLVSIRFSRDDDGTSTSSEWKCNPEVTGVEEVNTVRSPHGWYAVSSSSSSSSSQGKNARSRSLFSDKSPEELVDLGLATDALSTSQHPEVPLHAIAFDHPNLENVSYVHLFRDPRFTRIHAGHFPNQEQDEERIKKTHTKSSARNKRRHEAGGEIPLPRDHPQYECHSKGTCHADRIHEKTTAVEMFWIPKSIKEVVLSCNHAEAQKVKVQIQQHRQQQQESTNDDKKQEEKKNEKELPPQAPRPELFDSLPLRVEPHIAAREAEFLNSHGEPEVIRLREVGPPETTFNFVFLAGGYSMADREMFIKNVTDIAAMLMDPQMDLQLTQDSIESLTNIHRTCPFNRYWGFWNAYAVFQASNERGASRPLKGLVVDNNLGCVHPAEIERAVSCDRNLAGALTKVSPAPFGADPERVSIICVVNTHIYGGSAIYIPGKMHFSNFFNGFELDKASDLERMLSLVDHEIGHSVGNLMDEYSVGVSEPSGRFLRNCQVGNGGPPSGSTLQWKAWVDAKAAAGGNFRAQYGNQLSGNPNFDVLTSPDPICGFTNYYKPNPNCMLHRLNDFYMCPVCREQATLQLFESAKFVYEFPRLPFKDQVLLVSTDTSVVPRDRQSVNTSSNIVLHLNRLLTTANGFTVRAYDVDNTPMNVISNFNCPACIEIGPTNFAKYTVDIEARIRVTINDDTKNFVLPANRDLHTTQLQQETFFRIVLTNNPPSNISGTEFYNYTTKADYLADLGQVGYNETDLIPRYVYCLNQEVTWQTRILETGLQKNNSFCSFNLSRPAAPYEQPAALQAVEATLDTWVPIVLAITAIIFILLWLWASQQYTEMSNGKVRPIFKTELSGMLTLVRTVMTIAAVVFLIASIGAIGAAAYAYYNTSLLGKIFVIFGVVIAAILYLMAFFGFWAVSSRSKRMLIVNGVVLLIPLSIGIWLLLTLNAFGSELDGAAAWQPSLNATDSSSGVSAQDQVNSWMKKLEELWIWMVANEPTWACSFQGVLECSGYYTNCAGTRGSTATCPEGCPEISEHFISPCQKRLQDYIVKHYSNAVLAVALGTALLGGGFLLNTLNFLLLWSEKSKIQNRNQNTIKKEAARLGNPALATKKHDMYSMMLLKTLDKRDRPLLIREFKRIDRDGNGELTRGELAYFINGALKHKPSKAEIDKIFSVADLDNNGTISLREFLMIFGWESGEIDSVKRPTPKAGPLQKMASFARRGGKETPPGYHPGPTQQQANGPPPSLASRFGRGAPPPARPPPKEYSPEQISSMRSQMRQRAKDIYGNQFLDPTPQSNGGMSPREMTPVSPQRQQQLQQQPLAAQVQQQQLQQPQANYQQRPVAGSISQQAVRPPPARAANDDFEL